MNKGFEVKNNLPEETKIKTKRAIHEIMAFRQRVYTSGFEITAFDKLVVSLENGEISAEKALEQARSVYEAINEVVRTKGRVWIKGEDLKMRVFDRIIGNLIGGKISPAQALSQATEVENRKLDDYH